MDSGSLTAQSPPSHTKTALDPSLLDRREVARRLKTDIADGLRSETAAKRLTKVGHNRLDAKAKRAAWKKFLDQFRDPLMYLLIAAIAVSTIAWVYEGAGTTPYEVITIGIIVLINAVLGVLQEAKAENAVAALRSMAARTATVTRDGHVQQIPAEEVVPGDVLTVAEGDAVSADARLIEASSLSIGEASLTGESEPTSKDTATLPAPTALGDRHNMIFSGTAVARGHGRAVVTATGMRTEIGRIASLLETTQEEPTPLRREIDHVGRILGITVVAIASVVIASIGLSSDIETTDDFVDILLVGVSLAVAAVPEGLATILTVVLALGVQRMAGRRALLKNLESVETLGSASVVCSDKTGTLTKNEMTITKVLTRSGEALVTGAGYQPQGQVTAGGAPPKGPHFEEVRAVLLGGSLAGDASLVSHEDGSRSVIGDPTDAAFLVAEGKLGIIEERRARFARCDEIPFTSERMLMSSVEIDSARDGRITIMTKGAPDVLLEHCTHEQSGDSAVELTETRRNEIRAGIDELAGQALRTIAVARRELDTKDAPAPTEELENDLVFAGVVGMIDPPRPEAIAAVAQARSAGIRVVMITGDHPRTAARIAADLSIAEPDEQGTARVLTGIELDELDEDAFAKAVRDVSAYARVNPEHKLRIVDALQRDGHIVAMTGDGVNDAPALKAADIGVAMGITGTEVSKQASRMILADDNFATIIAAVREGRVIFSNIRKFLRYLLSSNLGEVLTVFLGVVGASVIGLTDDGSAVVAPLLATQLLWINLLTDSAPALALGVDPESDDLMQRPPRGRNARMIDRQMVFGVGLVGVTMALATLFTIDLMASGGLFDGSSSTEQARTAGFTVLVIAQLMNCLNSRSETRSAFRKPLHNPWLWAAIALSSLLQVLVVHTPFLNKAFGTAPLSLEQWVICAVVASSVLWVDEIKKLLLRTR